MRMLHGAKANRPTALRIVKAVHTLAWATFVLCIFAIWVFAFKGALFQAGLPIGIVSIEALVRLLNGWRCPLTAVAARYTDDRRDNFDIYLPVWLARHNKLIFGGLYIAGSAFTIAKWIGAAIAAS